MITKCGECPVFEPVPEDRRVHVMRGDGWCQFKPPASLGNITWGLVNEAISKERKPCSIAEIISFSMTPR